jgi:threonine/homoserine/homoserine lactone efflux protein
LNTQILVSFIFATATLAFSPGPDNVFVLILGCIIHTSIVAFGLSSFIQSSPKLLFILKLIGAFYLLYLAYITYISKHEIDIKKQSANRTSLFKLFKRGFVMNVINPKVSLFFMAFFPAFLFSPTLSLTTQFFILGLLFMGTSFLIFTLIVLCSGSVASVLRNNKRFEAIIKWCQIVVFVIISVFILITK